MEKFDHIDIKYCYIETHGCQMNEHDSEQILWILEGMNYRLTYDIDQADLIIFNTCMIRENAELKLYGQVGSLKSVKEKYPEKKIAICGCMMQIESTREKVLEKFRHVDIIFGTNNIDKLPELLEKSEKSKKTVVDIIDNTDEIVEDLDANRMYDFKGFVNVMYGCNNFCTYCIVPYARGREKSREPKHVLDEVEKMAKEGYKEVTLLGQNVNSYGKTLDIDYNFSDLLKDIEKIEGIERIRFMTSHPRDLSDELIETIAESDKVCNHIHLPVQSGSSKILKEMNRHYDREQYLDLVKRIKKANPNIAITTDIIVGFPGESDKDFEDTLSLVEEVRYDSAFMFLYSKRPGTKAAKMDNQVDDKIKHERFNRLQEKVYSIALDINKSYIGKTLKVLVEGVSKTDESVLTGRSEEFKLVHFKADKDLIGQIVDVEITDCNTFTLSGRKI